MRSMVCWSYTGFNRDLFSIGSIYKKAIFNEIVKPQSECEEMQARKNETLNFSSLIKTLLLSRNTSFNFDSLRQEILIDSELT